MTVNKRFVMYGNTVYEMKNNNKVELLPTDCFYLLTELYNENEKLKSICQDHRDHAIDFKADCVRLEKENMQYAIDNKELKCTNIKLNNEINMLKTTIARNESYIKRLTHTGVWENKCR